MAIPLAETGELSPIHYARTRDYFNCTRTFTDVNGIPAPLVVSAGEGKLLSSLLLLRKWNLTSADLCMTTKERTYGLSSEHLSAQHPTRRLIPGAFLPPSACYRFNESVCSTRDSCTAPQVIQPPSPTTQWLPGVAGPYRRRLLAAMSKGTLLSTLRQVYLAQHQ